MRIMTESKSNLHDYITDSLISYAVRFHGHLGPFLILGLKAGLSANEILGKDYFETKAVITTDPSPPCSCFVDGIQVATGCSMGKGNIKLKRGRGLSVIFVKGNRKLELKLRDDLLNSLRNISSKEELERTALNLYSESISELFQKEESTVSRDVMSSN